MSDLLPALQSLNAPTAQPVDASAIDKNLRSIRQVESTWRLFDLPDEVRLDLAAQQGVTPQHLNTFLTGIDRDLHNENPEDLPAPQAPLVTPLRVSSGVNYSPVSQDAFDQASGFIQQLRGVKTDDQLSPTSVQDWKLQAIQKGYMNRPDDGVVDGSWSPELTSVQRQMHYDTVNDIYRGGVNGQTGFGKVLDTLYHWTSPTGLMKAATSLDLWWDTGAIAKEASSWGDKWRKVGKSHGVLDFGRNLLDAMTGPVDDIVVPAVNLALLFTGVGVGTNYARLGLFGREALTAATAAEGAEAFGLASKVYKIPKLGSFVERVMPAFDLGAADELGKAGWLVPRMAQSDGAIRSAVGGAMQNWKNLRGVIASKGLVQTGMRLGLASQFEHEILPGFHGGGGLNRIPGVQGAVNTALGNPIAQTLGEALFTPYTIFEPGTFTKAGGTLAQDAFKFLGSTAGRAVIGGGVGAGVAAMKSADGGDVAKDIAIGAAAGAALPGAGRLAERTLGKLPVIGKPIHFVGSAAAHTSFLPLSNNEQATSVLANAVRIHLGEDGWKPFEEAIGKDGFMKAFANHYTGGDQEAGAQAGFFTLLSASIDRSASLQATAGSTKGSEGWWNRYWLARNKLQAQVRGFGEDATKEDLVHAIVSKESGIGSGYAKRFRYALDNFKDEDLAEAVALHNDQAQQTIRQLVSPDNLPLDLEGMQDIPVGGTQQFNGLNPLEAQNVGAGYGNLQAQSGPLADYVANTLDTFGDWNKYLPTSDGLRQHILDGMFDEATVAQALDDTGRPISLGYKPPKVQAIDVGDEDATKLITKMHDDLFVDGVMTQGRSKQLNYNPLAREIDPSRSRLTIGRQGTPWKQEVVQHQKRIQLLSQAIKDSMTSATAQLADGSKITSLPEFGAYDTQKLKALFQGATLSGTKQKSLVQLNAFLREHGYAEAFRADPHFIENLVDDTLSGDWVERLKLGNIARNDDGTPARGLAALDARNKELGALARRTAAKIDTEGLLASVRASRGQAEADRFGQYLQHVDSQGYDVVFGADYLMPHDLLHDTPIFSDINDRHMNAMTLGNFFARKAPVELQANVERARRLSIARELSKVTGEAIDPHSSRIDQVTNDLYRYILDPALEQNAKITEDLVHQNLLQRVATGVRTGDSPRSIQDLGLGRRRSLVMDKLIGLGYDSKEADAVWRGVKQGRYAEFKDLGLYSIEAKLRGRNNLLDALHVLGADPNAHFLRQAAVPALAGAVVGSSMSKDSADVPETLLGAAVGGLAGGAALRGLTQAASHLDLGEWARYGYLADNLAAIRDRMRFSLSPFFDLSRYTEAYFLSNTAMPKGFTAPFSHNPKALVRSFAKDFEEAGADSVTAQVQARTKFKGVVNTFKNASKGHYDPGELESTSKWFREVGIMGFDPTGWQSTTFHHLTTGGMKPEEAYRTVKDMYTYGTKGRSAAEQSINFIFFPFSFQKKAMQHAAGWLSDDVTRSILLHDAMKSYQILDDHYDLGNWAKEHLPAIEKLQQLNMFAFGLSPGRLGGINAPYINALVGNPGSRDAARRGAIFNLFLPQGANVAGAAGNVTEAMRKTIPAINDLQHMLIDAQDQMAVIRDPSHQTKWAQTRDASSQWADVKKGIMQALKQRGDQWSDLTKPGYEPLKAWYDKQHAELLKKYPGWAAAQNDAAKAQAELGQERLIRTQNAVSGTGSPSDTQFYQMDTQLNGLKAALGQRGLTFDDLAPSDYDQIRAMGVQMAMQNPGFEMIWNKFWGRTFGPLAAELR